MVTRISIDNPAEFKICNSGWEHDNIITVSIVNKYTDLYIELSEDNFRELKEVILNEPGQLKNGRIYL